MPFCAYAETNDQVGEARARRNLKICYFASGQYDQAILLLDIERAACAEACDQPGLALCCCNLAVCEDALGRHAQAGEMHRQSIEIAEESGIRTGQGPG